MQLHLMMYLSAVSIDLYRYLWIHLAIRISSMLVRSNKALDNASVLAKI